MLFASRKVVLFYPMACFCARLAAGFFLYTGTLHSIAAATIYSIGDPTAEEQLYLELINRARANPPAEGQRLKNTSDPQIREAYTYWKVDTNLMATQFALVPPTPPLSFNSKLIASARAHSQDMLTHAFQNHTGSDGSSPDSRMKAQGYNLIAWSENIFAYSKSVPYGHAGFEVDWGSGGLGGMLVPPVHRNNIHHILFREIGVGNIHGINGQFGPEVVTQDFGTSLENTPFITGVAYRDSNNNGFYDIGEGLAGVTVSVTGSSYYAVTASAGGYSVPVPANGSYTVTFSANGLPTQSQTVLVTSLGNVKVDYKPAGTTGGAMKVQLSRPIKISRTQSYFDVTVTGATPSSIDVQSASIVRGTWASDASASVQNTGTGKYRVTINTSSGNKFFRVLAR
jgi:hypothetical protein